MRSAPDVAKRARLVVRMAWYSPLLLLPIARIRATVDADVARWVGVVHPPVSAPWARPGAAGVVPRVPDAELLPAAPGRRGERRARECVRGHLPGRTDLAPRLLGHRARPLHPARVRDGRRGAGGSAGTAGSTSRSPSASPGPRTGRRSATTSSSTPAPRCWATSRSATGPGSARMPSSSPTSRSGAPQSVFPRGPSAEGRPGASAGLTDLAPMRILFVSGTAIGGSAHSTRELADRLTAHGHDVAILFRVDGERVRTLHKRAINLVTKLGDRLLAPKVDRIAATDRGASPAATRSPSTYEVWESVVIENSIGSGDPQLRTRRRRREQPRSRRVEADPADPPVARHPERALHPRGEPRSVT